MAISRIHFNNIVLFFLYVTALSPASGEQVQDIEKMFQNPPRQFSSGPLWVWNDRLTDAQIRDTLSDLAEQHVKQVWVHPRPGLMTPYLSSEWFDRWKTALREAERLDMNVWIYDENSYPSGFAGGLVPEAMPESRGQGLHFREAQTPPAPAKDIIAVYQHKGQHNWRLIMDDLRAGKTFPKGRYLVAERRFARASPWYGGKFYVDLLDPEVTRKFIEITMGAYQREIGKHFGGRVPGVFTDEPHLTPAGGLHWTPRMIRDFKKRWGYDILPHLPSLTRPMGDWRKIRHNFQNFLLEEFINCWGKPFHDYCEASNLEFTGHYWEHGWPGASHGGDNMALYAWHQRPAIDNLMNEYRTDTHAQFGNARTVVELASVANQLGRKRTLCEAYGAGGWDLRFEDMKRIGDWLYVLGVNTLNEHLSYITIRGARKRDHPQSFSYHTPWWPAYHKMADYFTRLSLVISAGRQVNSILVLEPTTSTWMYQSDASSREALYRVGNAFQDLVNRLLRDQVEFDLGCEDIMARHGSVTGKGLVIGKRCYDTVVLPPHTENLNAPTLALLTEYVKGGGLVLCCGGPPVRVDGATSDACTQLATQPAWQETAAEALTARLRKRAKDGFQLVRAGNDPGILFHQRRKLIDGEFLFLVNTSITAATRGTFRTPWQSIQQWCLDSGVIQAYPCEKSEQGMGAAFEIPPCGSLCLLLSNRKDPVQAETAGKTTIIQPAGACKIKRLGPNVLTLDYVTLTIGGETWKNIYFYKANQLVFQKHGMDRNPWDSAVQLRDTLITKTFPEKSGFSAAYQFTIQDKPPEKLSIVIERADLYTITCNGQPVKQKPGQWWLDKAFGRMDISKAAKPGKNVVTIKAAPMTIHHELESAYLLGDFALRAVDSGFEVIPPTPIKLGGQERTGWNRQGYPFYAEGISYSETFELADVSGKHSVSLPAWYGSVAQVNVNGSKAGYIAYAPWELDVTRWLRPGRNIVEVMVIGTLKNTLGPHHAGAVVGKAWPNMFRRGPEQGPPPGKNYHNLDYGLFKPFVLKKEAR